MKASERLVARLREEGRELPPCTVLVRTYRNRRTGIGTWSWFATCGQSDKPGHQGHFDMRLGSHWSMAELLAAPGLQFQYLDSARDTCVDPDPLPGQASSPG